MGENNYLLIIVLAFILGYMLPGMMKNMCGGRLFEFSSKPNPQCGDDDQGEVSPPGSCNIDRDCSNINTYKKYCHGGKIESYALTGKCECKPESTLEKMEK